MAGHGLGQMQCAVRPSKDFKPSMPGKHTQELDRLDSGVSVSSFQSSIGTDSLRVDSTQTDSMRLDSTGSIVGSIGKLFIEQPEPKEDTRLVSTDSGLGSINELCETPSLSQQLKDLQIQEIKEEPIQKERPVITYAQLKARTKEQKLADLASYDFNTTEEIPEKPKKIDPRLCESLIAEEERPPQFHQDADGDTVLHLTIVHNHPELASQVIDNCPSWSLLNIQNDLGQTSLHLAVLTGQRDIVRKLLVHGATVDLRDKHGNTPLHLASQQGNMDCVLALTRRVKHPETSNVPYEIPFQRIPQPADIQNYDGHTCLKLASFGKHFEVMKHLVIECRSNINEADWKSGRSLLHIAAEMNDKEMTEFLLSHPRIKMDAKTYEGHTALRLAQGRKHMDIVQLLMLAGAEEDDEEEEDWLEGSSGEDEEAMNCDSCSDSDDGFDDMEFQGQTVFPR